MPPSRYIRPCPSGVSSGTPSVVYIQLPEDRFQLIQHGLPPVPDSALSNRWLREVIKSPSAPPLKALARRCRLVSAHLLQNQAQFQAVPWCADDLSGGGQWSPQPYRTAQYLPCRQSHCDHIRLVSSVISPSKICAPATGSVASKSIPTSLALPASSLHRLETT